MKQNALEIRLYFKGHFQCTFILKERMIGKMNQKTQQNNI